MQNELYEEFIALRKNYIENQYKNLNDMQKQAVFTGKGPLLILAGAGSGKTTVLVNRISNLVKYGDAVNSTKVYGTITEDDIDEIQELIVGMKEEPSDRMKQLLSVNAIRPYNILAITFTNRAAAELKTRIVLKLNDSIGDSVNASTFHSCCVRMLRRDAELIGYPKSFTIYDMDDAKRVMKEIFQQNNIDDKFIPLNTALSAIGRLKDKMIDYKLAMEQAYDEYSKLIATLYKEYRKKLKKIGAMDFDDLIYNTVILLQDNKEVREYYQNKFKYILVDEYQDTSIAQFTLVDILAREHTNICVVGDDDQSIYKFRGATIENILSFEENYNNAKVIKLEQNYRSTANILNSANKVIDNNRVRKGKNLWTNLGDGEKITCYVGDTEQDEAYFVGNSISKYLASGGKLSDNAVLYRMNTQSKVIETFFARAGIPYRIFGGLKFFDRKAVKDVIAYLSILSNPQDDVRLKRIINEPPRKIGLKTISTLTDIAEENDISILDIILNRNKPSELLKSEKSLNVFKDIYLNMQKAMLELPLEELVEEIIKITGYKEKLKDMGDEGLNALENIGELVSSIKMYVNEKGEEASLAGYLEDVALISDLDNYDENSDCVVLMTIHSAKGLEFDNVYIVGMEDGIFPGDKSRFDETELEEERRLCYVGMTRARKKLYLARAKCRMIFGQTKRNKPSLFLNEIPLECVEIPENNIPNLNKGLPNTSPPEKRPYNNKSTIRAGMANKVNKTNNSNEALPNYHISDRISHMTYGKGTIVNITPMAGDMLIEVKFDNYDKNKKVMANYAKLSII